MYKITLLPDWLLQHEESQIDPPPPAPRKKKLSSKSLASLGLKLYHTVKSLLKDLEKLETVYIWRYIEINLDVLVSIDLI